MSWYPSRWLAKSRGKNGTEYKLRCPRCRGDDLYWNSTLQGGQCFGCKEHYNATKIELLIDGLQSSKLDDALAAIMFPRKMREPAALHPYQEHWSARWHLEDYRRLTPEAILKAGITYDADLDRICIPIHRVDGADPQGAYMSRHTDLETKGWKVQPFGIIKEQHWYNCTRSPTEGVLVLVEGIFDVLSPGLQDCAVALLGTQLYEDVQFWLCDRPNLDVVVWLDPDEAGAIAVPKIVKALDGIVKSVRVVEYSKEPGDCSPEEAREVLQSYGRE